MLSINSQFPHADITPFLRLLLFEKIPTVYIVHACFLERPAVCMHLKKRKTGGKFRHQLYVTHCQSLPMCKKHRDIHPPYRSVLPTTSSSLIELSLNKGFEDCSLFTVRFFNFSCQATCFPALKESFPPCQSFRDPVWSSQFILKLCLVFIL